MRWCGGSFYAAALPALLAREGATALLEACDALAVVANIQVLTGQPRVLAARRL